MNVDRYLLTILSFFFAASIFSQSNNKADSTKVDFIAKMDINQATKDGVYLNGYVVNIDYAQAKALHGKTIRVKGNVTIIKGIDSRGEISQGRQGDTKHILKPKIKIVKNDG